MAESTGIIPQLARDIAARALARQTVALALAAAVEAQTDYGQAARSGGVSGKELYHLRMRRIETWGRFSAALDDAVAEATKALGG